jgi:hypothetical protein
MLRALNRKYPKIFLTLFIGFCLTDPKDFGKEFFFINQGLLYFWSVFVFFVLSNISKNYKLFGDLAVSFTLATNTCSQGYLENECTFALCRG